MENITLCFDFGNTRLKCGVFKNNLIAEVLVLIDDSSETVQQLINKYRPAKTILSSVIDHNPQVEIVLNSQSIFNKVSHLTRLPFTTTVTKPEAMGADRIALASAAVYFYPGKNNLVIGMGSCITYNFINKYNTFLGGSISPGMEMRFISLKTFTAKLPLIKPDPMDTGWNFPLIGYDTRTNILSGVLLGMCKEIDGIIEEYSKIRQL